MEKIVLDGAFDKAELLNLDCVGSVELGNAGVGTGGTEVTSFQQDFYVVKENRNKESKHGGERKRIGWLFGMFV